MHPAVAELARIHGLSDEVAAAVDELVERLRRPSTTPSTLPAGFEPVALERGGVDPDPTQELPRFVTDRYVDLGVLGEGGMGEVRRVRDTTLNRTLAMKTLHAERAHSLGRQLRFLEEAQVTAQLQHPNIVPVHDLGELSDGRLWYTMKEVRGRTLADVIDAVHAVSNRRWGTTEDGWTLGRLVNAFLSVCRAVAYAHDRGVVHRDLKPENVMVGDHGEVWVLDWGLARVLGRVPVDDPEDPVETDRSAEGRYATRAGEVAGTPAYMPPEQARGEPVDTRADVYALGAILYELLSGFAPYSGPADEVLAQVLEEPPLDLEPPTDDLGLERSQRPLPDLLVEVCYQAMSRDREARHRTAGELADAVQRWVDGSQRREQALRVLERALAGEEAARGLRARAAILRAEGDAMLEGIAIWRSEQAKEAGWSMQDEAEGLEQAAALQELEVDWGLHAALRVDPDLVEANAVLAERFRARHAAAEERRDATAAAVAEQRIRVHVDALPTNHAVGRACAAYLSGEGALTLVTDPPGANVLLYRQEIRHRRLVEVYDRALGETPLFEVPLPMGSYVCVIRHPSREEVRYPIEVTRLGHWDGAPPGESDPEPVWLPPLGLLTPGDAYIPAGWFRAGGDPEASNGGPVRRLWCDALVMRTFPVTQGEYLEFLNDLLAQGRVDEALRYAARERGNGGGQGAILYGFDGRRFWQQPDAEGDLWTDDHPVLFVDWPCAVAYLAWYGERTARPWRLPVELEWEKAARGVDGRFFPWGDYLDPSFCCMTDSHRERRQPVPVATFPVDVSVYGVRGMAGNVRDWCANLFDDGGGTRDRWVVEPDLAGAGPTDVRAYRGGLWCGTEGHCRSALRLGTSASLRDAYLSFRGVYRPEELPIHSNLRWRPGP